MIPYLLLAALLVLAALGISGLGRKSRDRDKSDASTSGLPRRLTDPRDAAAILMVQQAAYDGQVLPAHKERILSLMQDVFSIDEGEAEGLFSFGRMAVGQLGDAADALPRLLRPVKDRCTLAEMKELLVMLQAVARVAGPETEQQRSLVDAVGEALSLPSSHASA